MACGLILMRLRLVQLGVTCKRCLGSSAGSRRDFEVACLLAAAALLSCEVVTGRWIQLHFAVGTAFSSGRWRHSVCNPFLCTHVWPACWLSAVDKSRASKSVEVLKVWEVCDDYLRLVCAGEFEDFSGCCCKWGRICCLGGLVTCCGVFLD